MITNAALINPNGEVVKVQKSDITVGTKPGWKWLPCPIVPKPTDFNKSTHYLTGPHYTVGTEEVTMSWDVVAYTAEELSQQKDDIIERVAPKAIFQLLLNFENRLRTLEAKPQVTANQLRQALRDAF
jgi:hypothetical protein